MRIEISRHSLIAAVLAAFCLAAPLLQLDQRLADGVDLLRESVSQHCALTRAGTSVTVQISSLEGALTTCQAVVRGGATDVWQLLPDATATPNAAVACELTRGPYAWAAIARVEDARPGPEGSRVCEEMREQGWLPRSEVQRPG